MKAALILQNMGVDLELDVGTSNVIKSIYRGVEKAGHEIDVIMPARRSVAIIADIEDLDNDQRPPLGLSQSAPFILLEQLVRRVQRWLKLPYFSFIDSFRFYQFGMNYYQNYSLVHEYYNIFSIGAAVACKRLGKPYVVTSDADQLMELELTGQPLKGIHKWVAERETKYIYDQAYKIICVSEPAIQNLIDRWGVDPDKIVLIPNGVNLDLFTQPQEPQAVRAKLGIGDKPVVMFVGGFQPWHGIDGLLTSFKQALAQVPEAQLVLVGDGPVRPETEQQIAQLGLTDCVHITGFVPHPEVVAYLSIADVVTIPYPDLPRELWFSPFKLYEYMAARKAMVASRSGQIADVITDGVNGRLVTPGNLQELTTVMVELLQDPAQRERLADNAFQQAVEKHSLKQYGEKITAVYAEAIQNQ